MKTLTKLLLATVILGTIPANDAYSATEAQERLDAETGIDTVQTFSGGMTNSGTVTVKMTMKLCGGNTDAAAFVTEPGAVTQGTNKDQYAVLKNTHIRKWNFSAGTGLDWVNTAESGDPTWHIRYAPDGTSTVSHGKLLYCSLGSDKTNDIVKEWVTITATDHTAMLYKDVDADHKQLENGTAVLEPWKGSSGDFDDIVTSDIKLVKADHELKIQTDNITVDQQSTEPSGVTAVPGYKIDAKNASIKVALKPSSNVTSLSVSNAELKNGNNDMTIPLTLSEVTCSNASCLMSGTKGASGAVAPTTVVKNGLTVGVASTHADNAIKYVIPSGTTLSGDETAVLTMYCPVCNLGTITLG